MLEFHNPEKPEEVYKVYPNDLDRNMYQKEAISECNKLGKSWRVPTIFEHIWIREQLFDNKLQELNGEYWSTTECEEFNGMYFYFEFYKGCSDDFLYQTRTFLEFKIRPVRNKK